MAMPRIGCDADVCVPAGVWVCAVFDVSMVRSRMPAPQALNVLSAMTTSSQS
jgi:hypothetical protein